MSSEEESNPELEALQRELSLFRKSPLQLSGNEIEKELEELIKKSSGGRSLALAFVGMPGSGKAKLIEKVARHFNVNAAHVRDLAAESPAIRKIEKEFYRISEIVPGIEKDFLDFVFKRNSSHYVIDGFPRTIFQALELYRYAAAKKVKIKIIDIRLQDDREVFQSFYRQIQRAEHRIKKGLLFGQAEEEEYTRIVAKIRRTVELDLYVIETLRALGADVVTIDATNGPSKMFLQFKEKLGISSTE